MSSVRRRLCKYKHQPRCQAYRDRQQVPPIRALVEQHYPCRRNDHFVHPPRQTIQGGRGVGHVPEAGVADGTPVWKREQCVEQLRGIPLSASP